MGELEKIATLRKTFIEFWVHLFHSPTLVPSQEILRKKMGKDVWDKKRDDLVEEIWQFGTPAWDDDLPLMSLSALDLALACLGKEDAGQREPPFPHEVAGRIWMLAKKSISPGQTTHTIQTGHPRNWLQHHLIVPERFPPYPLNAETIMIHVIPGAEHHDTLSRQLDNNSL